MNGVLTGNHHSPIISIFIRMDCDEALDRTGRSNLERDDSPYR